MTRTNTPTIETFGFTNPVLVSDEGEIIAGHGRVEAARTLGIEAVPTLPLSHLSVAQRKAYVLADNKLALNAGWDQDILAIELQGLLDVEFDVSLTGFSLAEVDFVLDASDERKVEPAPDEAVDRIELPPSRPVTRRGDLWGLGQHRLLCGDAQVGSDYDRLLMDEGVDLVFTDPPYNVKIDGHVCGLGEVRHREFAFASGEMDRGEFTRFLTTTLSNMASHCRDGAIAFVGMDWRHMREVLDAGEAAFTELKNLCVWNKTNGGMGTFHRSKHELVFVFKTGTAEHPTVKPVALVADAIRDCSKRGEIVLDAFGGSGSTLIAAQTCGRKARLIEYDPAYCDTIITRWQRLTGKTAHLVSAGEGNGDPSAVMAAQTERSRSGAVDTNDPVGEPSFESIAELRLGTSWLSAMSATAVIDPELRKAKRRGVSRGRSQ